MYMEGISREDAFKEAGALERKRLRIVAREEQDRIRREAEEAEDAIAAKNKAAVDELQRKLRVRELSRIALAHTVESEATQRAREFQDWQSNRKNNTHEHKDLRSSSTNIGVPT